MADIPVVATPESSKGILNVSPLLTPSHKVSHEHAGHGGEAEGADAGRKRGGTSADGGGSPLFP